MNFNNIKAKMGPHWPQLAQDGRKWKILGEADVQQTVRERERGKSVKHTGKVVSYYIL